MNVRVPDLLDNDLYKFLMQQFLLKYPEYDVPVEYKLTFRSKPKYPFNDNFKKWFSLWLQYFFERGTVSLRPEQADYLKTIPGMQPWYINWLRGFSPDGNEVNWGIEDGTLDLTVRSLKWSKAIWWEVPLMGNISELYNFSILDTEDVVSDMNVVDMLDNQRFWKLGNANIIEFGTRRRFSLANQRRIVNLLREYPCYNGTSNVMLAMENDELPKGTMAHELFMGIAPLVGYKSCYAEILNRWYDLYKPHYLTALTDTFSTEHFFKHTPNSIFYMYDGVRQDSGSELAYGDLYINKLASIGMMDISKKKVVYSNGLNESTISLLHNANLPFQKSFGWGTGLTNNSNITEHILTAEALNMVIKLSCVWKGNIIQPTVKISDDYSKATGPTHLIESIRKGERE